jgi:hypothetical protein
LIFARLRSSPLAFARRVSAIPNGAALLDRPPTTMRNSPIPLNPHLPPRLREVCAILAAGLLRLRRRRAEAEARAAAHPSATGEDSLRFPPGQSGHANRRLRRRA